MNAYDNEEIVDEKYYNKTKEKKNNELERDYNISTEKYNKRKVRSEVKSYEIIY